MLLDDLDLIDELTHPLRSRILHRLQRPHSVAELAEALDVPVTRLYHHIRRLEEIGMISVVATRQAGARTEHRYRNVALDYRLDRTVFESSEPETFSRAIGSLFDVARTEFQREVEVGALTQASVPGRATSQLQRVRPSTSTTVTEFLKRLHDLSLEFGKVDPEAEPGGRWRLFIAGFPLTD